MRSMISAEEAWLRIEGQLGEPTTETVSRSAAAGRVLARDVAATLDVPAQDVSAMDGYVVADEPSPGSRFPVRGILAAGDAPGATLEPGTALRIMTGAPSPRGAERVIPIECTDGGSETVEIRECGATGQHIRRRAEVTATGDVILRRGSVLQPSTLGLLATHGHAEIDVFARPSVTFLTGGDEVVAPEETPGPGQLRDSHSDFFLAACSQLGIGARSLGIVPDQRQALESAVREGMAADVLLMSGGVSMGEFDLVEGALGELGCEILFDKIAIQPGKPMVAARHERGWIFALPGNPASAMVTFWLLVRPALRRMMGFDDRFWHGALRGTLAGPLPRAKGRDLYLPARVAFEGGDALLHPQPPAGSHDVGAYGLGTALVRIPARSDPTPAGEPCDFLPLVEWLDRA